MKNLSLLFALLFSLVISAQETRRAEIFPNNHPEILIGKTVKVKPLPEKFRDKGYPNFYTDALAMKTYSKIDYKKSSADSLENKVFKVVSNDTKYPEILKLESAEGEIIYYELNKYDKSEYYFEVEGDLDLPEGFYCEYFQPGLDEGKKMSKMTKSIWGVIVWLHNNIQTDKLEVDLMLAMPTTASKGVTVIFDNGEKLELPNIKLDGKLNDGSREHKNCIYKITTDKEKKLFTENIITTIIFGKEKTPVNSDIPSMHGEIIRGVVECSFKTIEEKNKL